MMFYYQFHATMCTRGRLLLLVSAGVISVLAPMGALAHPPSFAPMVNYSNAGGIDVTTADVTGDNILDLITIGGSTYGFKVLPGSGTGGVGDGTFGSPQNYTSGFGPGLATGQWGVVAGDFNNDSKQDIAIANRYTENVSIVINNGSGFNTAVHYSLFEGSSPRAITTGYFNNDNVLDLAVADWGFPPDHTTDHWISVLLGDVNNPGTFFPEVKYDAVYQGNPYGVTPADIIAADFDGDGKVDLATANTSSDDAVVFVGNGDGTFQAGVHYGYASINSNGTCVSDSSIDAGDLNGDGRIDIVIGCGTTFRAKVLLNQGNGTFPASNSPLIVLYATGNRVRDVRLGELNNDGSLDMVTANGNTGTGEGNMSVFEGTGDGTFKPRTDYATGMNPLAHSVVIADFNGDGKKDIAVANFVLSTVSVFINETVMNPIAPTLTSISPSSVVDGGTPFTLTVTGTDFYPDSVINCNGTFLTTTYSSSTELTAIIPTGNLIGVGSNPITVFTPGPGGGASNAINLIVSADIPALSNPGVMALVVLLLLGGLAAARRYRRC